MFGEIARARAALAGARTPADAIAADQATTSALSRLLVVVENYPQLRSNEAFLTLMDEISGIENRLAVARNRYNEVVRGFNVMVKRFPTNLYAGLMGFAAQPYYPVRRGGEGHAQAGLQRHPAAGGGARAGEVAAVTATGRRGHPPAARSVSAPRYAAWPTASASSRAAASSACRVMGSSRPPAAARTRGSAAAPSAPRSRSAA